MQGYDELDIKLKKMRQVFIDDYQNNPRETWEMPAYRQTRRKSRRRRGSVTTEDTHCTFSA